MCKVSVIIPVFNVAPYLNECIDSVLAQTLQDFEVICVDDGSTDGSREVLESYAEKDSRLRVITTDHQGAGAARNRALQEASGVYLSILDADDLFDRTMLKKAVARAEEDMADVVIYRHERLDHKTGRRFRLSHMSAPERFPSKRVFSCDDLRLHTDTNWFMSVYGWTWDKLFRRDYVLGLEVRFQTTPVFNDMYFTYAVLSEARRISYMPDFLMCQRVNRPDATTGKIQTYWPYVVEALLKTRFRLEDRGLCGQLPEFTAYSLHMLLFSLRQLTGKVRVQAANAISNLGLPALRIRLDDPSIPYVGGEVEEWRRFQKEIATSTQKPPVQAQPDSRSCPMPAWRVRFAEGYAAGCAARNRIAGGLNPFQRMIKCYRDEGFWYTAKRLLSFGRRRR